MRSVLQRIVIRSRKRAAVISLNNDTLRIVVCEILIPARFRYCILLLFNCHILRADRAGNKKKDQKQQQEFCRQIEGVSYTKLELSPIRHAASFFSLMFGSCLVFRDCLPDSVSSLPVTDYSIFYDLSVMHLYDTCGMVLKLVIVVSNNDDKLIGSDLRQKLNDPFSRGTVEISCRFIRNQDSGVFCQSTRDRNALLLTSGESGCFAVAEF